MQIDTHGEFIYIDATINQSFNFLWIIEHDSICQCRFRILWETIKMYIECKQRRVNTFDSILTSVSGTDTRKSKQSSSA